MLSSVKRTSLLASVMCRVKEHGRLRDWNLFLFRRFGASSLASDRMRNELIAFVSSHNCSGGFSMWIAVYSCTCMFRPMLLSSRIPRVVVSGRVLHGRRSNCSLLSFG